MIIDFHTHIFPDRIAEKTISYLAEKSDITPYSDGTLDGLLSRMQTAGVDLSVALPVVTAPKQFDSINGFAAEVNAAYSDKRPGILSFGGIHPDCEDLEGKMKKLRSMGFIGIKIHPDYQATYINDEKYVKILKLARELDMIVVTHAGVDGGYRGEPVRCTPERVLDLIRQVPYKKFVLAHLGANEMPEESLDLLAGEDVYFDTAFVLKSTDQETFKKFVEKHGEDRILFATDTPWSDIKADVDKIGSFGLGKAVEEKIFSLNAKKLLDFTD